VSLQLAKWSLDRIARYIDVTPKTLTKHYSRELDGAADLIEGAAIEVLLANMGKGYQGAAGKMLEMAREGQLAAILKRDLNMGDRYAPFDHIARNARIVIVGIGPGRVQAVNAVSAARNVIERGGPVPEVLAEATTEVLSRTPPIHRLIVTAS
jgi:hypothetical protein